MWKITNKTNTQILKQYENALVVPLWLEMRKYKKSKSFGSFMEYITNCKKMNNYYNTLYLALKIKVQGIPMYMRIDEFLAKNNIKKIEKYYRLYLYQNYMIDCRNYNIKEKGVPNELSDIFTRYIYEKLLVMKSIWKSIDRKYASQPFTREKFHEYFKIENSIHVCPYCDIDTTNSVSNNQIEHFMPKAKYPFLSVNGNNLISSCIACNLPQEGKGTKIENPIISPYNKEIGLDINFEFDLAKKNITIDSAVTETQHYISLLKLDKRYSKKEVFNSVMNRADELYDTLIEYKSRYHKNMSTSEIQSYFDIRLKYINKNEPLYFATKEIFEKYPMYLNYKLKCLMLGIRD